MTKSPRTRWTFSLRTLFAVVTLFALVCWLGWNLHRVHQRDGMVISLSARGAMFGRTVSNTPQNSPPLVWKLLGAEPFALIEVPASGFSEDDLLRLATLFPEATIRSRTLIDSPRSLPSKRR